MWRMSVIADNGFFDEDIRIGEEPDLCYRVRHKGGRILCVDFPMVTHDLGMHGFAQYWDRAVNSGRGYASIAMRFRRNSEKMWFREMLINFVEPAAWIVLFLIGGYFFGWGRALGIVLAWWLIRGVQIAYKLRNRKVGWDTALMYGLHCQFVRLPLVLGQLKVLLGSR